MHALMLASFTGKVATISVTSKVHVCVRVLTHRSHMRARILIVMCVGLLACAYVVRLKCIIFYGRIYMHSSGHLVVSIFPYSQLNFNIFPQGYASVVSVAQVSSARSLA